MRKRNFYKQSTGVLLQLASRANFQQLALSSVYTPGLCLKKLTSGNLSCSCDVTDPVISGC